MKPVLSVVIPAYNEEEVLAASFARLDAAMRGIGEPYELIFVNDGSRDGTAGILKGLAEAHEAVRALHFSRNFGHQIAVTAGLDAAEGDAVVIIDCDLQDPPEVIPEMVAKWREGFDVVYGKRAKREGETAFKKLTAWGFYRAINGLSGVKMPEDTGDFRLVSRAAADAVRAMPEHNRYLRGMFTWIGFRQAEVLYNRDKRFAGETKYPLKKMLKLAMDGMLSFSLKPLAWITWLGGLLAAGGGLWLLILLVLALIGHDCLGTASLAALALLLSGAIIGSIGILGAYLGRAYDEVRGRPLYFIASKDGYLLEEPEQSDKKS